MELYERATYMAPYEWLISKRIQEWDLKQANISILRSLNILTDEQYTYYQNIPKQQREIEIGIMRKNKDIEAAYKSGLIAAKQAFFTQNNLQEPNILYIDHDSITTVHNWRDMTATNINGYISPYIQFILKNTYTSFYKLPMMDFLYYNTSSHESFRFKGIDDYKLRSIHKDYFIDLLLSIAYSAQTNSILDTLNMIKNVYALYCNKQMNLNYYREFNPEGRFKILITQFNTYYTDIIDESHRHLIDISYNTSILRLFYKIFMTEYFRQNTR